MSGCIRVCAAEKSILEDGEVDSIDPPSGPIWTAYTTMRTDIEEAAVASCLNRKSAMEVELDVPLIFEPLDTDYEEAVEAEDVYFVEAPGPAGCWLEDGFGSPTGDGTAGNDSMTGPADSTGAADSTGGSGATGPTRYGLGTYSEAIHCSSPGSTMHDCDVDTDFIGYLKDNPGLLWADECQLASYSEIGLVGFEASPCKPGSLLHHFGLRDGDVLTKAGGQALRSLDTAWEAFGRLAGGSEAVVLVDRAGVMHTFTLHEVDLTTYP